MTYWLNWGGLKHIKNIAITFVIIKNHTSLGLHFVTAKSAENPF